MQSPKECLIPAKPPNCERTSNFSELILKFTAYGWLNVNELGLIVI